jgi:transcriptional regulator with XRE-family HTH domain
MYDHPDRPLPMRELWIALREKWTARHGPKGVDLARFLGVSPQQVSQWTTGSDPGKVPPMWALLRLAREFRLAIVLEHARVALRRAGPSKPDDAAP